MKGTKRSKAALTVLTTLSLVGSSVIIPIGSKVKAEDIDPSDFSSSSIQLNNEVNFDTPLSEDDLNWEDVELPVGVEVVSEEEATTNNGFGFADFISTEKLKELRENSQEKRVRTFKKVQIFREKNDNSELLDFLNQTDDGLRQLRLDGISLSNYAEQNGLSIDELKQVVESMTLERWEEMLADEQISEEQYNSRLVHLDEIVDRIINFDGTSLQRLNTGEMPLLIERAR